MLPRRNGRRDGVEGQMPGIPGRAPAGLLPAMPGQMAGQQGQFLGQSPYASQMSPLDQLTQIRAQQRVFLAQMAVSPGQAGQQGQVITQISGQTPDLGKLPGTPGQVPGQISPMPGQTPGLIHGRAGLRPLAQLQLNAGGGLNLPMNPGHKGMGPLPILHQMRRQRHDPPRGHGGGGNYQRPGGYLRPRTEADGPYIGVFGGARKGRRRDER